MRIFKYLFKEVNSNFMAVATMLLLIFLSARFVKYLASAASGEFAGGAIISLILFRLPSFLEIILPLSLFLGIMLGYGRLYVESEMIILQASGVSKRRLLAYTQGPALIVMMIVASCSLYFTPSGYAHFEALLKSPETTNSFNTLIAGTFKKNKSGNMVIYAGGLSSDKSELQDVFVVRTPASDEGEDSANANELQIIKAKRGQLVTKGAGHQYLEFYDGVQIDARLGGLDYAFANYESAGMLMRKQTVQQAKNYKIETIPTLDLMGSDQLKEQAALQWRLLMPLMIPIIAMIALALSETSHRKGRYVKMLPGIILFFLYLVMLGNARTQIEKGVLPAEIALWLVHGLFFAIALLIFNFAKVQQFIKLKLLLRKSREIVA